MASDRRNIQVKQTTHERYMKLLDKEAKARKWSMITHDEFMELLLNLWEQEGGKQ